LACQ